MPSVRYTPQVGKGRKYLHKNIPGSLGLRRSNRDEILRYCTKIEDLVGNVLGVNTTGDSIHKWDFYVNVSPVGWVGAAIDEVTLINEILHINIIKYFLKKNLFIISISLTSCFYFL